MDKKILLHTDPLLAQEMAYKYLGKDAILYISDRKNKKFMIHDPHTNKWIHFGDLRFSDWTRHKNEQRRQNYLKRTVNIKGNWKGNPYSSNNLSRHILWGA